MADSPVVEAPAAAAAAPTIESLNRMMRSLIHSMYQVGETGLSTDEVREAGLDRYNGVVSAAALSVPAFQMLLKMAFASDLEEDRPQHVNDRINNAIKAVLQFDPVFAREQAAAIDMLEVLARPEFAVAAAAAGPEVAAAAAAPAAAPAPGPEVAAAAAADAPNVNALMRQLAYDVYTTILRARAGEDAAVLGDMVEAAEMATMPNVPIQNAGLNEEYIEVILTLYKSYYGGAALWNWSGLDLETGFGEIFQRALEVDRAMFIATVARVLEGDDALGSPLLADVVAAAAAAAAADAGAGMQDVFTDVNSIEAELIRVSTGITAMYMTRPDEIEEIPKVEGTIFDYSLGEESSLLDYLLNNGGDGCVFLYRGHFMGLSKSRLADSVRSGEALYYQCLREATFEEHSGGFGPWEVVRQRYIVLPLAAQFYVKWEEVAELFGTHSLWEIEDTETRIAFSASHRGAFAGGPVDSAHHCQSGTDKQIRKLRPVKFMAEEDVAASASPVATIVKVRKDGVNTPIDVADSLSVASVRAKYAAAIGVEPDRVKFVVAGRYLLDSGVVIPGTIIAATVAAAAPADEGGGGAAAAEGGMRMTRGRVSSRSIRKTRKIRRD